MTDHLTSILQFHKGDDATVVGKGTRLYGIHSKLLEEQQESEERNWDIDIRTRDLRTYSTENMTSSGVFN